ncbi:MAG: RnfABCDGE type electron transport complex subunit B [Burkholderiaceae bacterium]|jgi:electron transport complex protein RnfB|nr:RnfABCDGE type electron transport complex subunit B [Burkholderiaceae bacterium]
MAAAPEQTLKQQIENALPQTQCQRCGYTDCAAYAQAIASGAAAINQCPPGGQQGVAHLAAITGQPPAPLNPQNGPESVRQVAFIDEAWCIGCTLCIQACPMGCIVGTHKRMHTICEAQCTGCALCLPACPVDCIALENASGQRTGWQAWSAAQAQAARQRYALTRWRRRREAEEHAQQLQARAQEKLAHLAQMTKGAQGAELERKRAVIEAALQRARARRRGAPS